MGFWIKPINVLPRNVLSFVRVCCELFNFRLINGNGLMTGHAKADARKTGIRSLGHTLVATGAINVVLQMNFVIEGDRLDWSRLPSHIFFKGVDEGWASRGEDRNTSSPCRWTLGEGCVVVRSPLGDYRIDGEGPQQHRKGNENETAGSLIAEKNMKPTPNAYVAARGASPVADLFRSTAQGEPHVSFNYFPPADFPI